jgi:hypothetical protein
VRGGLEGGGLVEKATNTPGCALLLMLWCCLTLVPQRLAQDLVSRSLRLGNVLCGAILVDLSVVVLGIATELVEAGGLHGLLNSGDVDGRERVEVGHPSAGDGHALS